MKSQLSFEYFITIAAFIIFVVYLSFQLITITPSFISELKGERIRSEAYQISELLINDAGEPIDWETKSLGEIKRIGLSNSNRNKTNLLSLEKINGFISHFGSVCTPTTYENVRRLIDTEHHFLLLLIDKTSDQALITCNSPESLAKPPIKFSLNRIVSIGENSFGVLTLQMW